jgi:putative endonuclease
MDLYSYVYIMTDQRRGTLYVGLTTNLIRRVWEHKNDLVPGFTRKYGLHRLVYYETHGQISDAAQREKSLKRWLRTWKITLIEQLNPTWRDLYKEICGC